MKVIIAFILKHYFLLMFVTFEFFSISLLVLNNDFHNASYFNSSNSFIGQIYENYSNLTGYLALTKKNDALAKENAKLKSMAQISYMRYDVTNGNSRTVTSFEPQYEFIAAKVVNNSVNKRTNYITINKGSNQGIKRGMGVIFNDAVIGIVKNVSESYSSIVSILHTDSKISAKINSSDYFGSVIWEGNDYNKVLLKEIPNHVKINQGDTISTSAFSSIFPENMLIGFADTSENDNSGLFINVEVNLYLDFKKLSHVYVVNNLKGKEKIELEAKNND
ncbi:MAG: rod shape-determining protein MreC [Flavobacteriales bacterium]|nr:rod shape-determining protein MreC [Flavobacteriales bacterium]